MALNVDGDASDADVKAEPLGNQRWKMVIFIYFYKIIEQILHFMQNTICDYDIERLCTMNHYQHKDQIKWCV